MTSKEEFKKCKKSLINEDYVDSYIDKEILESIEQDLYRLEKLEKVIEILKSNYFIVTSNANSETGYIMCVESDITQREYELLKEVLEDD